MAFVCNFEIYLKNGVYFKIQGLYFKLNACKNSRPCGGEAVQLPDNNKPLRFGLAGGAARERVGVCVGTGLNVLLHCARWN